MTEDTSRPGEGTSLWLVVLLYVHCALREFVRAIGPREVRGMEIAIFNVDGDAYAIDDSWAHQGRSLGAGKLTGKIVTCRAHGWQRYPRAGT